MLCMTAWDAPRFYAAAKGLLVPRANFVGLPDVVRAFQTLIKKLISELIWKPRDESFEVFDLVISTCGLL